MSLDLSQPHTQSISSPAAAAFRNPFKKFDSSSTKAVITVRGVVKQVALALLFLVLVGVFISLMMKPAPRVQQGRDVFAEAAPQVTPPPTNEWGIQFVGSIDELAKPLLNEAQAAAADVAAFRRRQEADISWRDLIVPVPAHPRTQHDVDADYVEFRLRELEEYRRLTTDAGAAKAAGETFLNQYLKRAAEGSDRYEDLQSVYELGLAALDAGSRDPMVRTYATVSRVQTQGNFPDVEKTWVGLLDELGRTKYPKAVQYYAAGFLFDLSEDTQKGQRWRRVVSCLMQSLEEDSQHPELFSSVCRRFWKIWSDASSDRQEALIYGIVSSPKIAPYLRHAIVGQYYVELAWNHRGGQVYSKLTKAQEENFAKYLGIAADHLQYAWKLRSDLPYAPVEMQSIAMGRSGPWGRPYFWFIQTTNAQFDYNEAYSAYSMSLLSRWGGSVEELVTFAQNCANTRRFQMVVPYVCLNVIDKLETYEDLDKSQNPVIKKLLREFVGLRDKYRADHPDGLSYEQRTGYREHLIQMLEDSDLHEASMEIQRASRKQLNWSRLRQRGRPARYLATLADASAGRQRDWVNFDKQLRRPWDPSCGVAQVTELRTEFQRLKEIEPKNEQSAAEFYRHVETILSHLEQFSAGQTVALNLTEELPGLEPYCDLWDIVEGQIELSGRWAFSPQVCLRPLANFAPPLEVEGQLELIDPAPYLEQVGIGWSRDGMKSMSDTLNSQPLLQIERRFDVVYPSKEPTARDLAMVRLQTWTSGYYAVSPTTKHRLRAKLWPDYAEFQVDDQACLEKVLPESLHPAGWISFGARSPQEQYIARQRGAGALRWGDLRVRRLEISAPPPNTEPVETRAIYWEKRFADAPDDGAAVNGICGVRFEQKRFDELLALADQCLFKHPKLVGVHRWRGIALQEFKRDYAAALREYEIENENPRGDPDGEARTAEIRAAAPQAELRNTKQARQFAENLRYEPQARARALAAQAAAYATDGDYGSALSHHREAMKLATPAEQVEWEPREKLYESGQPFRFPEGKTD